MALATLFVTMPFVVRELLPILEQMDLAEEEAARWVDSGEWVSWLMAGGWTCCCMAVDAGCLQPPVACEPGMCALCRS